MAYEKTIEERRNMNIMVLTEEKTASFQLGETVMDLISKTKKTLNKDEEVRIVTNNAYLAGWCAQHHVDVEKVDDDTAIAKIADHSVKMVVIAPAVDTLGLNPGQGIALVADDPETHVLVRAQEELLRTDENGRVNDEAWIAMLLPPEYRMVPSDADDTYVRVVAQPSHAIIKTETNKD